MKKLTFVTLILTSFLLIAKQSTAQDYKVAAGLKFGGYESGVSGKYFLNSDAALEGVLGLRDHGVAFTGLYELHKQAFNVTGLRFYYGFGAHAGTIGKPLYDYNLNKRYYDNGHLLLGIDGILGLEYKIADIPIAVSLDLNPRIEVANGPFFDLAPGLGIKYIFK